MSFHVSSVNGKTGNVTGSDVLGSVASGTNQRTGITAAMTAGTITVNNTLVTANTRIFLTAQNSGGTPGALRVSARSAGTSFTITSDSNTDTSTVAWLLVEPAA